jgi:hypothetical protein
MRITSLLLVLTALAASMLPRGNRVEIETVVYLRQ